MSSTNLIWSRSAVMLTTLVVLAAALSGCASQPSGESSALSEQDVKASRILLALWTPDKDVARAAIEESRKLKDERIREALVAKLKEESLWSSSDGYLVQEIIYSLEKQGMRVRRLENSFELRWPGMDYTETVRMNSYRSE